MKPVSQISLARLSVGASTAALFALALTATSCTTSPPAPQAASVAPTATGAMATPSAAPPAAASAPAAPPASAAVVPAAPPADDIVGKPAPDFTATAQNGTSVHLAALKGKMVVLYFYPKDETPGCTKEACSFRDSWDAIAKTGAVLIGVSADNSDSHKAFVAHYKLPFLLVSDPDGSIGRLYGVPFQGHHHRETFVIGADGKLRKAFRDVDVTVHATQVLGELTHAT